MRRSVVLAVVALVGALLTAVPASAVPPLHTGSLVYTDSRSVYRAGLDLSNRVTLFTEPAGWHLGSVQVSADGARFAESRYTASGISEVWLHDASGRAVRHLASHAGKDMFVADLAINKTGTDVAYLVVSDDEACWHTGATFTRDRLLCGFTSFRYDPLARDDSGFMLDAYGTLRAGRLTSTGLPPKVPGIDQDLTGFAVSPDGTRIAWSQRTGDGSSPVWTMSLAYGSTPVELSPGDSGNQDPEVSFSPDGSRVYYLQSSRTDTKPDDVDLAYVPVDGGPSVHVTDTPAVDEAPVQPLAAAPAPPAAPTARPAYLDGTRARLEWVYDLTGMQDVSVVRTSPGTSTKAVNLHAVEGLEDSGLLLGHDYAYTIVTRDRYGQESPPLVEHLVATARTLSAPRFASSTGTGPGFPVGFSDADHIDAYYYVDGSSRYPWAVTPGTTNVFGQGGSTADPGHTYDLRATFFDKYGNATALAAADTTVPLDQRGLSTAGPAVTVSNSSFWLGTATVLRPGASMTLPLVTDEWRGYGVWPLVSTCPTCGLLLVYRDGVLAGRYDTYSATARHRVVLHGVYGGHTYTFRTQPQGSHRDVVLDGIGLIN